MPWFNESVAYPHSTVSTPKDSVVLIIFEFITIVSADLNVSAKIGDGCKQVGICMNIVLRACAGA